MHGFNGLSRPAAMAGHGSSPILSLLAELHRRYASDGRGAVANYIPELATADPDHFGICLATVDGQVYEVGDSRQPFTIQSISKPFVYGLALEDRGAEAVLARVGVEPSGEAFNSIVFDERSNRPFNPMVNAGAIATTALIDGASHGERLSRMLGMFARFTGRAGRDRREGLSLGEEHRPSQPGHHLPRAQRRDDRGAGRRPSRPLLPPVLGAGRRPRPGGDGGDPCQRRRPPADRHGRHGPAGGAQHPQRHEQLRHVQLLRRVGLPRRPAGEKRRFRRDHRGVAGPVRHRRLLAVARRAIQQRPRHRRLRGSLPPLRSPRLRSAPDRQHRHPPRARRNDAALEAAAAVLAAADPR